MSSRFVSGGGGRPQGIGLPQAGGKRSYVRFTAIVLIVVVFELLVVALYIFRLALARYGVPYVEVQRRWTCRHIYRSSYYAEDAPEPLGRGAVAPRLPSVTPYAPTLLPSTVLRRAANEENPSELVHDLQAQRLCICQPLCGSGGPFLHPAAGRYLLLLLRGNSLARLLLC